MRCDSFDHDDSPVATITLLHKSLPAKVYGAIILKQQKAWVHKCEGGVQCARRIPSAGPWPAYARLSDRWTHHNGHRYVIDSRPLYIWIHKRVGDLPVFKEDRSRSSGMKALLNCAYTFDHRKQPLDTKVPCTDATRHVSDAVVKKWSDMCATLAGRSGNDRVGDKWLDGTAKKVTALQPRPAILHTMPGMIQVDSPEPWHLVVLNSAVVIANFARELVEQHDPDSVRPFLVLYYFSSQKMFVYSQNLTTLVLEETPRVSYSNTRGWTQMMEKPTHKKARGVLSGTCDYLVMAPKLVPLARLGDKFVFLRKLFFFGFMRTFHVTRTTFAVFRRDFLELLMPEYRRRFREYRAVFNPNFVETFSLVDAGLGMTHDWFKLAGLKFEQHHQNAKKDGRKGLGLPVRDIHAWHAQLFLKSTLALDLKLHTMGRIPPTRALRRRGACVDPDVFALRHSPHMLGRTRTPVRDASTTLHEAFAFESRAKHKGLSRRAFKDVPCLCRRHFYPKKAILRALLLVCRNVGRRVFKRNPQAYADDEPGTDGHVWTPRGFDSGAEGRFPARAVCKVERRMRAALRSGRVRLRKCWRAQIRSKNPVAGSVRPGKNDHVRTRDTPDVGNPPVLAVQLIFSLEGNVREIDRAFPRETAERSTWIAGRAFGLSADDLQLIKLPWRGGRDNMRIPVAHKLRENHAVPLVEVAEPAFVTHKCVSHNTCMHVLSTTKIENLDIF